MRLDELRKLAEAATPGPWTVRTFDGSLGTIDAANGVSVAQAQEVSPADRNAGSAERRTNAALIAALHPAAVLQLIAVAEAAKKALERMEYPGPSWPENRNEVAAELRSALSALEKQEPQ